MNNATGSQAAVSILTRKATAMSHDSLPIPTAVATSRLPTEEELREISASLRGLRYGSVNIVVQDGVIIQIDRMEKRRLRNRDNGRS